MATFETQIQMCLSLDLRALIQWPQYTNRYISFDLRMWISSSEIYVYGGGGGAGVEE